MNTHISNNEFPGIPMYTVELTRERSIPFTKLNSREKAVEILHSILDKSPVERLIVLYLNGNSDLVGAETLSIGSLTRVEVPLRELFRGAIVAGVEQVILAHNHPIGEAYPSIPDLQVTGAALNVGKALGIFVKDHIVTAPNGTHYSILDDKNAEEIKRRISLAALGNFLDSLGSPHFLAKSYPAF